MTMNDNKTKKDDPLETQEFLIFSLGEENYGVNILKVQEIRRYENITRIANTPNYIKGVTNLRGSIVPILDLRLKFNLENADFNDQTVVIVVNCLNKVVGLVVDRVLDVMSANDNEVQPPPEHVVSHLSGFITGLISVENDMNILIDVERLISLEDIVSADTEE